MVISDSHADSQALARCMDYMTANGLNNLIHLGDYYDDANGFIEAGFTVIRVPGVWKEAYQDPAIPNRMTVNIEGWNCFLTHTPNRHQLDLPGDSDPQKMITSKACDIFMYGHTHIPRCESQAGLIYFNPGHLKLIDNRGYPATFAIATFSQTQFEARILTVIDPHPILQLHIEKKISQSKNQER